MKLHPLARTLVTARPWPFLIDMGVAAVGLAFFFSIVTTGAYWLGKPVPVVPISHSIGALPAYAFYSMVRIGIAYFLSLT
ncbi:MAG: ABC transporter permease, partial [Terracidiphilus sp.]